MKCSHYSLSVIALAVCVMLLYAASLSMSASCVFAHADRLQSRQHHHDEQGSSAQNSLCSWACQAIADTIVAIGPLSTAAEMILGPTDLAFHQRILSIYFSAVQSRAPPLISFIGLG